MLNSRYRNVVDAAVNLLVNEEQDLYGVGRVLEEATLKAIKERLVKSYYNIIWASRALQTSKDLNYADGLPDEFDDCDPAPWKDPDARDTSALSRSLSQARSQFENELSATFKTMNAFRRFRGATEYCPQDNLELFELLCEVFSLPQKNGRNSDTGQLSHPDEIGGNRFKTEVCQANVPELRRTLHRNSGTPEGEIRDEDELDGDMPF